MEKQDYMLEYEEFITEYKIGTVSGEQIGQVIARMAQYFGQKNMIVGVAEELLHKKAAQIVEMSDQNTGKPLSVAKADILIKATDESIALKKAKMHLENIEQYINALKYFQKGILNEYSHMGA